MQVRPVQSGQEKCQKGESGRERHVGNGTANSSFLCLASRTDGLVTIATHPGTMTGIFQSTEVRSLATESKQVEGIC